MYNVKKLEQMGYLNIVEVKRLSRNEETWYSEIVNASKEFVKEIGWNEENLFYYIVSLFEYVSTVYFDGTFICSIPSLKSVEEMRQFTGDFSHLKDSYYKMYAEGKYSDIIRLTDRKYKAIVYNVFYEKMDKDQRFREFIRIHKICDNSLSAIPSSRIKELLEYGSKIFAEQRMKGKLVDNQGYITVYRGFGKTDDEIYNAIPWSTNIESIFKFSYKFGSEEAIFTGKVHISNVAFIYDEDYENEVLVIPNSVIDIRELDEIKVEYA